MKSHEIPEGPEAPPSPASTNDLPVAPPSAGAASKWKFLPVLDSRGRRIPHLETRNGRFIAQLWMDRGDGKKTARRFSLLNPDGSPAGNIPEAKEAIERLRQGRREEALPSMGQKPTLAASVETYLASGTFAKKRPGTRENEKYSLLSWVRHCGSVRIDKVTTALISSFVEARLKGEAVGGVKRSAASERTVNADLVALRNVLNAGLNAGHLRALPRMPKLKLPPVRRRGTIPPADVERLIDGAPQACKKRGRQLQDFLRLLTYCGAREKEALQLRWQDVDFDREVLTIGADGTAKNKRERRIEFNAALASHLRDMHSRRTAGNPWMFPNPYPDEADGPTKGLRPSLYVARADANLPEFGFHDCRRFFATMAIQSGVDIQTVARWLGHQDGGVLVARTYADVLGDHRKRMAANLSFGAPVAGATAVVEES